MSIPILSIAQMRQWEQATWAAGVSEQEVIRKAGRSVARIAVRNTQPADRILILAGKGHNGDDARCTVEWMPDREIRVLDIADPAQSFENLEACLQRQPDWIVDGLFGIGLNRPLNEAWIQFIERVNRSGIPVLSVDVPSGLDADHGKPLGTAIRAVVTVTLGAPKEGLLMPEAEPYVGRLEVGTDIGLVPCPIENERQWTVPGDFAGYPPRRLPVTHKGTYGHVAILAGSLGYHGAAVLAARGALRAQPGLVTVYPMENVYQPVASQLQAAMVHPWHPHQILPDSVTTVLIGPGLADPKTAERLAQEAARLWQDSSWHVIVDASALDWLPCGSVPKDVLRCITPHPGEAARMLKIPVRAVQADRVGSLRRLSQLWGNCWVVLKGHHTLIGRSTGPLFVNSSGNPGLAQGGSGDVLAGFIGGLLAQPALTQAPDRALRYAVWRHGDRADSLQSQASRWTLDELLAIL